MSLPDSTFGEVRGKDGHLFQGAIDSERGPLCDLEYSEGMLRQGGDPEAATWEVPGVLEAQNRTVHCVC